MCDYSLEHVISRAAEVGDRLVSTRFADSITRGFAAASNPNVAVCLRPGTELAFDGDIAFEHLLGAGPESAAARVARFRKVDTETLHVHHDALELPDGRIVLLTRLVEGQHATVLQLPVTAQPDKDTAETRAEAESLARL